MQTGQKISVKNLLESLPSRCNYVNMKSHMNFTIINLGLTKVLELFATEFNVSIFVVKICIHLNRLL